MQEKQQGGGFTGYGSARYGSYGGQAQDSPQLQAAANYLANRCYQEAMNVLNHITDHSARECAEQAVRMEPSNIEYRQLMQQLNFGGMWYSSMGESYGRPYEGFSRFCISMALMNICCTCCCI